VLDGGSSDGVLGRDGILDGEEEDAMATRNIYIQYLVLNR